MHYLVGFVLLVTVLGSTGQEIVDLQPDQEYELRSINYPKPAPPYIRQSWHVRAPPGSQIDFSCYDIRLAQDNPPGCGEEVLILDDGREKQEICGHRYDVKLVTPSNLIFVEVRTGKYESGGITCSAKIYREIVKPTKPPIMAPIESRWELRPGGEPRTLTSLGYPNPAPALLRQSWFISTSPESRIRITCRDIRLVKNSQTDVCDVDSFTVVDGDRSKELCGAVYDFTLLSSDNVLGVHLKTGDYPSGGVSCEVRGIVMDWYGEATPPPPTTVPPYLGLESEEVDSSEHGGPPGSKGTTCDCGWSNKASKRIVNGREAGVNEYPFMAALVFRGDRYSFCGASIVSHHHALTAAHCTFRPLLNGNKLAIIIGEHDQSSDDETNVTRAIDVAKIVQHEHYDPGTLKHDISLLILEKKIEFSQLIGPVCLSNVQLKLTRKYIRVIGWGLTAWNGPSATKLQKVDTRVIHMESCHKEYSSVSVENPTQICVYSDKKSACMGDSGGPVVWVDPETNRYTQVGLVSFGRICARTDPAVYTDVSAYIDWVQKQISANSPSDDLCFKRE